MKFYRILFASILLSFPLAAGAQTRANLSQLMTRVKPGVYWFGLYIRHRNIGNVKIDFRATAQEYRIDSEIKMNLGTINNRLMMSFKSDRNLALKSYEENESSADGEKLVRIIKQPDGTYRRSTTANGSDGTPITFQSGGVPQFFFFLMVPLLDWSHTEEYSAYIFRNSGSQDITVRRMEPSAVMIRGVEQNVGGARTDDSLIYFRNQTLLRAQPINGPMFILPVLEKEAAADLPDPSTEDEKKIRSAVVDFLRGALEGNKELLEKTINFDEIQKRYAESAPDVAGLSPQLFREKMLEGMLEKNAQNPPDEQTRALLPLMDVMLNLDIKGNDCTVTVEGRDRPLFFKRTGGVWQLVWMEDLEQRAQQERQRRNEQQPPPPQ